MEMNKEKKDEQFEKGGEEEQDEDRDDEINEEGKGRKRDVEDWEERYGRLGRRRIGKRGRWRCKGK